MVEQTEGGGERRWSRSTPWRQGSVIPREQAVQLGLVDEATSRERLALVVSHDCDIVSDGEREPNIEVLVGRPVPECLPDKTHAKHVRLLHIELNGPRDRQAVELEAQPKATVPKRSMGGLAPDGSYSIEKEELNALRSWLAARYKRASIPDGLQKIIRDAFEEVAKKGDRPRAIRGIWIDFEPDADVLPAGEKYELWVVVVYSSSEEGAQAVAEEAADLIEKKLGRKNASAGADAALDLRECEVRSDTEFTLYDTIEYRLFRLEYLSLRVGAEPETGRD